MVRLLDTARIVLALITIVLFFTVAYLHIVIGPTMEKLNFKLGKEPTNA